MHSADLADAVSRLRRAMRRAARAADPESGLSVAQLEMLSCMAENPGARPGQLARLLRLAPSSVATLANSLRQADLVTRTGGAGDRRTASLDLTPAGLSAVTRWKTLNERLLSLALDNLPPASRSTLEDALPALADLAGAVDTLADEPAPLPAGGQQPRPGPLVPGPLVHKPLVPEPLVHKPPVPEPLVHKPRVAEPPRRGAAPRTSLV